MGFLTRWWPSGSWSANLEGPSISVLELGKSCIAFQDLALEVTKHHFCSPLLVNQTLAHPGSKDENLGKTLGGLWTSD